MKKYPYALKMCATSGCGTVFQPRTGSHYYCAPCSKARRVEQKKPTPRSRAINARNQRASKARKRAARIAAGNPPIERRCTLCLKAGCRYDRCPLNTRESI